MLESVNEKGVDQAIIGNFRLRRLRRKKTIGDNCHPSKRHYSVAVSAQMRVYVWGVASERDGSRNDSAGVFRP